MAQKLSVDRQRKNITLVSRKKSINSDSPRTSICLEDRFWEGLTEICRREEESIDDLCDIIEQRRILSSRTSALRVFPVTYFRLALENAERALARQPGTGFSQPPQMAFPSIFDTALEQFSADQKRYQDKQDEEDS